MAGDVSQTGWIKEHKRTKEIEFHPKSGMGMLILVLVLIAAGIGSIVLGALNEREWFMGWLIGGGIVTIVLTFALLVPGFFIVNPNECRVLVLFGKYRGSVRKNGFFWTNPFTVKQLISLRIRNFDGQKLKVNDSNGNPIEISAVVVWKVVNTAEALFDVDNYQHYVEVQSESALRHLASQYPYDTQDESISLRGSADEVGLKLKSTLDERLDAAGVSVLEARLNHLAYSPEIAAAMLQRQQADAIIAARQKIVDGAVGMVEMALDRLKENKVVELDDERKAAMVSNLLVVLCSDHGARPVVNAGTLY
ncbi:MAG: SPFH domain-containing protein [Planctomycetota bacterium]